AIEGFAPDRIFKFPRHQWNVVRLPFASYRVEATGPTVPLGATALSDARPAIQAALTGIAKDAAYTHKLARLEEKALRHTACRLDRLPALDVVDLTTYLPFLRLTG